VENLDLLLADMETFNTLPVVNKMNDLTDKLLNAFDEQCELKSTDLNEKEELGVCTKCQLVIKDSAVLAGSSTYHPNCFNCTHCGKRLGTKFFCVENDPYCEEHQEVSLPVCGECGDCIREGSVLVSGASFHPHCFTCSHCGQVIMNKFYTTEENKFLCQLDYQATLTKCSHCCLPILERILTAVDKKFHPACFRCALCDAGLDGVPFILSGTSVNCKPCYTKYKAAPCARCGEGIVSTGSKKTTLITCNGQSFHQQCYNCQDCELNLCGEFVCCDKGDILCFLCDSKRKK